MSLMPPPDARQPTRADGITTERMPGEPLSGRPALAYDRAGSKPSPLLVCLHGIGGNRTNWIELLQGLADGYCVVAWDGRGYGLSDDYDGPLNFADFSHDLARLLDHLGAERAHLCGLSMGGRILQDFVHLHPARVASLILLDTDNGEQFTRQQREEFVALRQAPLKAGKTPADIAPMVAQTLKGDLADAAIIARLEASMAALHKDSYLKTIEAFGQWRRIHDLRAVQVPTLILYGGADALTPPTMGEEIAAEMPHAAFVVIPDAGHLANIEAPAAVNDAIRDFLAPHRTAATWR